MALTTSDLSIVRDAVFDARAKWYETGLQLGVPPSSLDSIRTDSGSSSEKFHEMLKVWLETAPKPTWQNILDALRNCAVGELSLAESVEANYCHTTAESGGQASGQVMPEGTQLQYIQELKQKLQDSERQLAQQIEEQNHRKAEAQQRKQWLHKISTLEQEKQEACKKIEAGEKQICQLKKLVGDHENIKKRLEEQVQHFQQKAEEHHRKIEILKETREKSVTQLKCTIDEQRRQLDKLESRLEEEINNKKQLQEQLQAAMKQAAVKPHKIIRDMRWHKESNAPEEMRKGSAATDSIMAYFNGYESTSVYSYNSDTKEWSQLPDIPYFDSTLVVVKGMLTMVGGRMRDAPTNSLLSLMGEQRDKKWQPHYPPMPTKRYCTAAICSGHSLIVAGGNGGQYKVEVLDTATQQWHIASSLISNIIGGTISICGERLYINDFHASVAFTCSIPELLESCQPLSSTEKTTPGKQSKIWRRIADLPHKNSTLATLCGQLVAVGGWKDDAVVASIFIYNEQTNSWEIMEHIPTARYTALVAIVNEKMMVIGGKVVGYSEMTNTNVVEMLY